MIKSFSYYYDSKKKIQMYLHIIISFFNPLTYLLPTYLYYILIETSLFQRSKECESEKNGSKYVIQMVFFTLKRFWFQQSLKTCRSPNHHLQVTVGLLNIFFCHWWFIHPDKIDRLWANRCVKKVINGCRNSRRG